MKPASGASFSPKLSGARINGRFTLRCAILSFCTHMERVDEVIAALERGVRTIA